MTSTPMCLKDTFQLEGSIQMRSTFSLIGLSLFSKRFADSVSNSEPLESLTSSHNLLEAVIWMRRVKQTTQFNLICNTSDYGIMVVEGSICHRGWGLRIYNRGLLPLYVTSSADSSDSSAPANNRAFSEIAYSRKIPIAYYHMSSNLMSLLQSTEFFRNDHFLSEKNLFSKLNKTGTWKIQ